MATAIEPSVVTVQRGVVTYIGRTAADLGVQPNPNMWNGDGWRYCVGCGTYTHHDAHSHRGQADCVEVCQQCHRHYAAAR